MPARNLAFVAALAFHLVTAASAAAQYERPAEVFFGFSRLSFQPGEDLPDEGMPGWYGGVTGYVTPWLGFTADVSGNYGSVSLPPNPAGLAQLDINQHSILFGPEARFLRTERFAASVHALVGMSRGKASVDRPPLGDIDFHLAVKQTKLAGAFGVSLDFNITENIAWRIVQPDVFVTSFAGGRQNNFRLSTGLVVRIGERW